MFSSASSSNSSLVDDADDVIKQRQRAYTTNLHCKPKVSAIQVVTVESTYPEIWEAIMEIEPSFVISHADGLWLQPKLYMGIHRSGFKYIDYWVKENHVAISHKGMTILRCVSLYKRFTTYDEIFAYLKTHDWAQLEPDRQTAFEKSGNSGLEQKIKMYELMLDRARNAVFGPYDKAETRAQNEANIKVFEAKLAELRK